MPPCSRRSRWNCSAGCSGSCSLIAPPSGLCEGTLAWCVLLKERDQAWPSSPTPSMGVRVGGGRRGMRGGEQRRGRGGARQERGHDQQDGGGLGGAGADVELTVVPGL